MKIAVALVALSIAAGKVAAWGEEGHMAVGYIAMEFLTGNALSFVQSSLGSTYSKSLGPAATWADSVKYSTPYEWSQPYHFIDAEDSPLQGQCSVEVDRDSSAGNTLLNAIANYTVRVQDTSLSTTQRQEALKFLDHFIGDIGQPLHVEAYEVGGNDIDTVCGGQSTELHATWDTGMIETMLEATYGSTSNATVEKWAESLATQIKNGSYQSLAVGWINCSSTTEPASKRSLGWDMFSAISGRSTSNITPLECPLQWAIESNSYDCSYVFSYTKGADLCTGSYYNNAIPIINQQIAKQGYRLAAWLNDIFN